MNKFLSLFFILISFVGNSLFAFQVNNIDPTPWSEAKKTKAANIVVYWYTTNPFIYEDNRGNVTGIEPLILEGFKKYVKKEYDIDLNIYYTKSGSFIETFFNTRDNNRSGVFGASAFSITELRKNEVDFVLPYMPDISVLISNNKVPLVNDEASFRKVFEGLKAVTIKGTTYEEDLLQVQKEWGVNFEMHYIGSNHNILNTISNIDNSFGYIDLPIYLIQLQNNPSINVHRQNLLPIKREGYSFMIPKNSDWKTPFDEYIKSESFQSEIEDITSNYLDRNLYQFIEDIYLKADNNVGLLTKEKELQHKGLVGKNELLEQEKWFNYILLSALSLLLIFGAIIFYLFKKRYKNNQELARQSKQISLQAQDIEKQKSQLEKRNAELTHLNEEKNTLIKVLAHDLRSPINQIQGFSNIVLLETNSLSKDQENYLHKIKDITIRVNKMIGKILDVDALESGRVNLILEEIDLSAQIKQVLTTFAEESNRKQIEIEYIDHISESEAILKLDRVYITQIIENLVSNALKFSNPHTKVTIELKENEENVQFNIKDQGQGFTEDDMKRLFKKYSQLSARPTSGEKSTGLGLSIVKKFVELMNGTVHCESEEGKGANFIIEFPKTIKTQN